MGDVIVARVQATDKAAEGVVVIQLILLGINQADMIVNIIRHVAVCLDANYVAGFVLCRVVNHFNELLRLAGALGAGIGGVGSFAALYGLGVVGLSAAGITSGLATAGAIVGGGMVAGVFVLAAPIAALAAGGVGVASHLKSKQLRQEKERLYSTDVRGVL